ncbi:MAG TPA: PQQ-binding-like beta-propeller repeat protein, partial [bacterium]|nr:PQQ-binding-like beta-propeller repeat protein [bacterium]
MMVRSCRLVLVVVVVALPFARCSRDCSQYRYSTRRTGDQPRRSRLSDPDDVMHLAVGWTWPSTGREGGYFRSSPVVFEHRVFIGSSSGFFYALDAKNGTQLWQFPAPGHPLRGTCRYGDYGIQASASRARIGGGDAVIFGAPDPAAETGLGSARLYALEVGTGKQIWASDIVAHVTGCTSRDTIELHERIAYSSPLVYDSKV